MGEATYYLKARFQDEESAGRAYVKVEELLTEMSKAYDWWQENRHMEKEARKQFWSQFSERFPEVYAFLEFATTIDIKTMKYVPVKDGDCNNGLAGHLSYTEDDADLEDLLTIVDGVELRYHACVWHFADWNPLMKYLKSMGAISADYVSDEYVDYYDLL